MFLCFWPQGIWDLNFLTKDWIRTPCIERRKQLVSAYCVPGVDLRDRKYFLHFAHASSLNSGTQKEGRSYRTENGRVAKTKGRIHNNFIHNGKQEKSSYNGVLLGNKEQLLTAGQILEIFCCPERSLPESRIHTVEFHFFKEVLEQADP